MFVLDVTKNQIAATSTEPMTSGSSNVYACQFKFSNEWQYLQRVAVFATDVGPDGPIEETVYNQILDDTNRCFIPWEVNKIHDKNVYVGVFGVMDGNVVLPTIWCDIGQVLLGVTTGVEIPPPTPELYEQILSTLNRLQNEIGSIEAGSSVLPVYKDLVIENVSIFGGTYPKNVIFSNTTILTEGFSVYLDLVIGYLEENQNGSAIDLYMMNGRVYRLSYDVDGTITKIDILQQTTGGSGEEGKPGQDGADGADGFSPTIRLETIDGGTRVIITDKEGEHSFNVMNGKDGVNGKDGEKGDNGSDGFSPTVEVTEIDGGHRVTITDEVDSQSFDVLNGKDGGKGDPGEDGADGKDGEDGFSPTVSITPIDNGTQVTITDKDGPKSFDVLNGKDGSGAGGTSGWFSPQMTSDAAPVPYKAEASDVYQNSVNYAAYKAFDGVIESQTNSASGFWHSKANKPWLQIYMPNTSIKGFMMAGRVGYTNALPNTFDFMGSNDGIHWELIASYSDLSYQANLEYRVTELDTVVTYSYYRWANMVCASTYGLMIDEIQFLVVTLPDEKGIPIIPITKAEYEVLSEGEKNSETGWLVTDETQTIPGTPDDNSYSWWSPKMTSENTPFPYVPSASSYYGDTGSVSEGPYYPYYAFDGNEQTFWHSSTSDPGGSQWLSFSFGGSAFISGIRLLPRSAYLGQSPKEFTIEISNDGTNWITVKKVSNLTASAGVWNEIAFDAPVSARSIRLSNIANIQGNNYTSIAEVQFYASFPEDVVIGSGLQLYYQKKKLVNASSNSVTEERVDEKINTAIANLGFSSEEVYSTEEVRIGTFLDKPLYRKVYTGNTPRAVVSINYYIGELPANIDILVDIRGCINAPPNRYPIQWCAPTQSGAIGVCCYSTRLFLQFELLNSASALCNAPFVCTIEYTKTTD